MKPRLPIVRVLALGVLCLSPLAQPPRAFAAEDRVVYDLVKLEEHGLRGPIVRLGEGAASLPAVLGGFNTGFTQKESGALRAHGAEAELVLSLSPRTAYRGTLVLTPRGGARTLGVFVNGRRVARAALRGGRQEIAFEVPAAGADHADTYLTFAFHGRARAAGRLFRGRRFMQKPKPEPVRALVHSVVLTPTGEAEGAATLIVHALVPPGARLVARVQGGGTATVRAAIKDEPSVLVGSAPNGEGERSLEAPLTAQAGEVARFELVTTGAARFLDARILAPSGVADVSTLVRPKNVVLWFIDTLRADKLRCYNPKTRVHTPNFDAFARGGTMFRRTLSQSSHSKPSAATVLTGHYPASHGARTHQDKLRRDVPMLSELFRQAGHETVGFASNGFIGPKHGFVRGWHTFRNLLLKGKPGKGPYLLAEVRGWLARRKARAKAAAKPFFLYVHSIDPHVPYTPPHQYLSMYWKERYRGRVVPRLTGHQLDDARAGKFRVGPTDKRYVEALYDGEVSAADHYFGQMMELLEREGLSKDTLVIVSADHGEELWEHGQPGHGHTLFNELIGVPLLFGPAPLVPSARVVEGSVEMVDVAPTILALAGLAVPERAQGRSLVPMMRDEGPASPVSFSVHEGRIAAAQQGRFKYIVYRGGAERVFDLDADPLEQKDISKSRPHVRRHLRALLSTWLVREGHHRKARDGLIGFPDTPP